ncbi:M23 family metallopeptidase [Nannocystis bainbridge]|uniref:M23 family metallopeptidase n=1 Tax=Nannocystis bainbridge TaxID=2995303 RepID=A0ABT5DZ63_9BACT|nr:M23 family metallopeptidase [Nannocystis bainbridge]MDC0718912.1 M23 family metallopeptidase [Nannocystis bainbridge]
MTRSTALLSPVLLVSFTLACGDSAGPSGLSVGTITSASALTATDAATSDSGSTGGATTTDSATTAAPCDQLTLCPPTTTSGEPTSTTLTTTSDGTTQGPLTTSTTDPNLPADPCDGLGDGPHCGGELGGLADHNSLYQCSGGLTGSVTPCPAGCEAGACKAIAQDPCASAMSGNGLYCGGTLMGGDAAVLYDCQNGATASQTACNAGCKVNPPGVADACNPESDPCQGAMSGDGLYCGQSLPAGDANDLYDCAGGKTVNKTVCPDGCQVNAPGVADACKAVPNGGECCLQVPPGVVTQGFSACGNGGSHYGIDYGVALGTPIYAGIGGTVVGQQTGLPNCYDMGCTMQCWNAFNYVKLKSDCGDPNNPANDLFVYYLHIEGLGPGIQNGSHVDQGQLVAYSGNSGCSSAPHIHLETVSVPKGQGATLNTCTSENPHGNFCP